MSIKRLMAGITASLFFAVALPSMAMAASTVVVTPTNQQGWNEADTRPGGDVNFVNDPTAPLGLGALQLTTNATTAAKAQYLHETNTPLAEVTDLSYFTKQNPGTPPHGAASYQLLVNLTGTGGFTTLVYEPYQNGVVTPGVWQEWENVELGQFWSSRTVTDGTCAVVAGAGGAPFYNLTTLKTLCPNAVVVGYGVNIGTFNPSYNVLTDAFKFNETTYDFEVGKDACKKDGWKSSTNPEFKNQGDCVSYNASGGQAQGNPSTTVLPQF